MADDQHIFALLYRKVVNYQIKCIKLRFLSHHFLFQVYIKNNTLQLSL
jgi:hypothetical protein